MKELIVTDRIVIVTGRPNVVTLIVELAELPAVFIPAISTVYVVDEFNQENMICFLNKLYV